MSNKESWKVLGWSDEYGNVKCSTCGRVQSPAFKACLDCCQHDTLDFTEQWIDNAGWALDIECSECGKNFGFNNRYMIANYKAVRREEK